MPFNSFCQVSQLQSLKARGDWFCVSFVTPWRNTQGLLLMTGLKIWKVLIVIPCRHPLSVLLISALHMVPSSLSMKKHVSYRTIPCWASEPVGICLELRFIYALLLVSWALCLLSFLVNSLFLSV